MTLEGRVEKLGLAEMENAIQIEQSRRGAGGTTQYLSGARSG